jgi:hypothetical protein
MNLPQKLGTGQNIFRDGVRVINGIIDYLNSPWIQGDNRTVRTASMQNQVIISAVSKPGGGSGAAAAEYAGYFKVVSIDDETVKVVNGADEESTICGSFTAGSSNVSCTATELTVSGEGVVYLRIYYTTSYQYEFGFAARLPSVNQEIYRTLASIADGVPAQVWTGGAMDDLNRSYWL